MQLARIFVSSVQKELAAERRAVHDFVQADPLLRRFFTVFLFEDLPAVDQRADTVYLIEVDRCDVYVGLFGNEYGFEDAAGAPTEHEFDRATAHGKPRLVYLKGADDKARHAKMGALVRKAGDQLTRRRWHDTGADCRFVRQSGGPPRANRSPEGQALRCGCVRRGGAG